MAEDSGQTVAAALFDTVLPLASFLYAISTAHCMPVSLGQDGKGLGTMWGWETAEVALREAGITEVVRHVLPHDPMNVWFVSRK